MQRLNTARLKVQLLVHLASCLPAPPSVALGAHSVGFTASVNELDHSNMRFVSELSLVAAILSVASAALIAHGLVSECANEQIAETTYIGADKNVKVTFSH